ncbi:MAG: hypothetical protein ACXABF_16105 [Candidatus Thorarchaeota archaeon]|jgi:hypothetical protein
MKEAYKGYEITIKKVGSKYEKSYIKSIVRPDGSKMTNLTLAVNSQFGSRHVNQIESAPVSDLGRKECAYEMKSTYQGGAVYYNYRNHGQIEEALRVAKFYVDEELAGWPEENDDWRTL